MASAMRQLHRRTNPLRNLLTTSLLGLRYRSGAPAMREFYSKSLFNCDIPQRASTRRYSSSRIAELCLEISSQMHYLWLSVATRVFAVLSYFPGSENQEIPHSARRGTGFFISPTLIVTSARLVGRVSTVFDSGRNSVFHNCFIAKTIVYNADFMTEAEVFCARPVAVNFAADVAVLEVQNPMRRPPLALAKSVADMDDVLICVARHGNCHGATGIMPIYPWAREKACRRPKAPWPLDDKVDWADYRATETEDDRNVWLSDICGTPWFNLQREVVGMASWAAENADGNIHSYAVPPSCIKLMVDYVNTKGPHDPIVVDRWINSCTGPEYNSDINEECLPGWTTNVLMKVHHL